MNFIDPKILTTMGQSYTAGVVATAEVSLCALRAGASDLGRVAEAGARALRTPEAHRSAAVDYALQCAFEAQARQLPNLSGLSTLWNMAFLRSLDAAQRG